MIDKMKPLDHWVNKLSGLTHDGLVVGSGEVKEVYDLLMATGLTNEGSRIGFYAGSLLGSIPFNDETSEDRISMIYNHTLKSWTVRVGQAFTVYEVSTNPMYAVMKAVKRAKEQAQIAKDLVTDCDSDDEITIREVLEEASRFNNNLCRLLGLFYQLTVWE